MPLEKLSSSHLTYSVNLRWKEKPNNPNSLTSDKPLKKIDLSLDLIIHPNDSGRIIVNYPGLNEDVDGIGMRYKYLANQMQSENLGAVVRSSYPDSGLFLPTTNLKKVIDYSINNAKLICYSSKPEVLLIGFSAGASAVATLASSYEKVTRILLVAPSGDMPREFVESSLKKFIGEVYIIIGENDEVVGPQAGQTYYNLALAAIHKELFVIPHCDHYFQSEVNDMIFKKAPFYAFAQGDKPKFP